MVSTTWPAIVSLGVRSDFPRGAVGFPSECGFSSLEVRSISLRVRSVRRSAYAAGAGPDPGCSVTSASWRHQLLVNWHASRTPHSWTSAGAARKLEGGENRTPGEMVPTDFPTTLLMRVPTRGVTTVGKVLLLLRM